MGIHVDPKRGDFDNQIRTHGSVDYTSIARRFSHGCHRLVNNRAVRLYDFVLRHRAFTRVGNVPLNLKKRLRGRRPDVYHYALKTRGYYYELADPVPVNVLEGRIMGEVKKPIAAYVRKPGVDYGPAPAPWGDAALRPPSGFAGRRARAGDRSLSAARTRDDRRAGARRPSRSSLIARRRGFGARRAAAAQPAATRAGASRST